MSSTLFRNIVWAHHKQYGRHELPWRPTSRKATKGKQDPYKILVSEVMLQQTQVERVIPFYKKFIKQFPTVKALAEAPLSEVLKAWQGLGYNRRAKMLHAAAKELVKVRIPNLSHRTNLVLSKVESDMLVRNLEKLPGVGPYTARAVMAFAYNTDVIFVETNIRTAITHHFFATRNVQHQVLNKKVDDAEVLRILEDVLPKGRAREWYSALMDYGAHLKKSGVKLNAKSKRYTKQSAFKGSLREARGAILRALATKPEQEERLLNLLGSARKLQVQKALEALLAERLVALRTERYYLAD